MPGTLHLPLGSCSFIPRPQGDLGLVGTAVKASQAESVLAAGSWPHGEPDFPALGTNPGGLEVPSLHTLVPFPLPLCFDLIMCSARLPLLGAPWASVCPPPHVCHPQLSSLFPKAESGM